MKTKECNTYDPSRIQLREKNGKLNLSFGKVDSVKRAKELMEDMVPSAEPTAAD